METVFLPLLVRFWDEKLGCAISPDDVYIADSSTLRGLDRPHAKKKFSCHLVVTTPEEHCFMDRSRDILAMAAFAKFLLEESRRDEIVRKRLELSKPQLARQLHYRHDVRGHERCLIRRGILPLDPEIRKKLLKRGYKVYEHTKPSDETNARLLKRGFVTKKSDEWLAIKVIWVDEHQRGPEDGPYIPALRTTGSKERTLLGVTEGSDARG